MSLSQRFPQKPGGREPYPQDRVKARRAGHQAKRDNKEASERTVNLLSEPPTSTTQPHSGAQAPSRNLTCDEWRRYLPGEPYRKICPDLRLGPKRCD